MKTLYRAGVLWGGWTYTNLTKYLPRFVIERIYHRMKKPGWFGVYANMGHWTAGAGSDHQLGFVSAPPTSAVCPITAGSLTWNNQIGFSLQLHSVLTGDIQDIAELMHQWIDNIVCSIGLGSGDFEVATISKQDLIAQARRLTQAERTHL
jgi:hypothetical protein